MQPVGFVSTYISKGQFCAPCSASLHKSSSVCRVQFLVSFFFLSLLRLANMKYGGLFFFPCRIILGTRRPLHSSCSSHLSKPRTDLFRKPTIRAIFLRPQRRELQIVCHDYMPVNVIEDMLSSLFFFC